MTGEITLLLHKWRQGEPEALEQLTPLVYTELRRIASFHLRSRPNCAFSATELVNEAYLRLAGTQPPTLESRAHFVSFAARVMRRVLVDAAREQLAQKRGALQTISIEAAGDIAGSPGGAGDAARAADVVALDEALAALAQFDGRKASAVEMRYFGGMTSEEIAAVLGVSVPTVTRDLRTANAWLRHRLATS